jgi:hypothetical protein
MEARVLGGRKGRLEGGVDSGRVQPVQHLALSHGDVTSLGLQFQRKRPAVVPQQQIGRAGDDAEAFKIAPSIAERAPPLAGCK